MIVDGINLIDGVIQNASVESGSLLPTTRLDTGRLFFLTQLDGAASPGLYIFNGTEWESSGETGDIESVVASTGILGGGNSGDVSLEVDTTFVATKTTTDGLEANKLNRAGDTMTGNLAMSGNSISGLADPTADTDASNKQYVDTEIANIDFTPYVDVAGDTMTGTLIMGAGVGIRTGNPALSVTFEDNVINAVPDLQFQVNGADVAELQSNGLNMQNGSDLTLAQDPTLSLHAATKQYVDSEIQNIDYSAFLQLSGGTMTGSLILDADPTLNLEAATKQYVDAQVGTSSGNLDTSKVNKSGDTMTGFLVLNGDPTLDLHAAPKQYVDTEIANIDFTPYLEKAGGTITGNLSVNGQLTLERMSLALGEGLNFTEDNDYFGSNADARIIEQRDGNGLAGAVDGGIVIRGYTTDDNVPRELLVMRSTREDGNTSGDTFTWRGNEIWHAGNDGAGSGLDADLIQGDSPNLYARRDTANTFQNFVTLHDDPVQDLHAATKQYVDQVATGLDFKQSCRVATTENISLSGLGTIDGITLIDGHRVLVKDQTNSAENGIYVASSGAWTRAEDADNTPSNEVSSGMFTFVEGGTENAQAGFVLQSTSGTINLGTTPLTFVRFSGTGQIEAGPGIAKVGNELRIGPGSGIQVDNDGVSLFSSDPRNVNHTNIDMIAGAGLTGGGNISADRTFNVGQGTGIDVSGSAVSLDVNYTDNRYQRLETFRGASSSTTANPGDVFFVDTRSGEVTINLPGSPVAGDQVTVMDVQGNFDTNRCVIGRNGNTIMSLPENMEITTENASVTLVYSGSSATGWRVRY